MNISEIFYSIDGEGIRSGELAIFIRTYGCSLRCKYCDSMYACVGDDSTEFSVDEILAEIEHIPCKRVTLTGGEPLLQEGCYELVQALVNNGYEVNIETNRAESILDYTKFDDVIITMDWKSIYSGMSDRMLAENMDLLRTTDVLKFVVADLTDLEQMKQILIEYQPVCHVFVSPVFGKIEPRDIVEFMIKNNLQDVRVQLQLHKFIWEPDRRGV